MSNARDKANIPSLNFSSTGIDDNATSTAITIDSSDNVGIGGTPQTDILLSLRPTGYTDNSLFLGSGAYGIYGTKFYSQSETTGGSVSSNQLVSKIETNVNGRSDNRWYSLTSATATNDFQYFSTGGSERLRIDGSGNVGIGTSSPVAPLTVASGSASGAISLGGDVSSTGISDNTRKLGRLVTPSYDIDEEPVALILADFDGSDNQIVIGGGSSSLNSSTKIIFSTSANINTTSGSERMRITSAGKVLINTTVSDNGNVTSSGDGTSGNGACYGLVRGSFKSTLGMDSVGNMNIRNFSGEIYVTDSGGTSTTISPHNFSVITDGASEDLAWSYYSRKGDTENDFDNTRYISADITKVIRKVENLTGDKLIYTGTGSTDDGSTISQNIIQSLIDRIETLEAKVTALETTP